MTQKEVLAFAKWLPIPPWRLRGPLAVPVNLPSLARSEVESCLVDMTEHFEIVHPVALIVTEVPTTLPGWPLVLVLIGGDIEREADPDEFDEWTGDWYERVGVDEEFHWIAPSEQQSAIEFLEHSLSKKEDYCVELCSWMGSFQSLDTQSMMRRWESLAFDSPR